MKLIGAKKVTYAVFLHVFIISVQNFRKGQLTGCSGEGNYILCEIQGSNFFLGNIRFLEITFSSLYLEPCRLPLYTKCQS